MGRRAETGVGSEWIAGSSEINRHNEADTCKAEDTRAPLLFFVGGRRCPRSSLSFLRARVIYRIAKVAWLRIATHRQGGDGDAVEGGDAGTVKGKAAGETTRID